MSDFTSLPDLALRSYRSGVIAASDESFEERENLIQPWEPRFSPETFGPKGQEYDGWETRRRRGGPGHDWAIIRLGMPGIIRGVVIDTAWFKGNYPPHASVEACRVSGYPSVAQLNSTADWVEIVPRSALSGDAKHEIPVSDDRIFTHVRLNIHPDGGVARLRVHGEVVPDPELLTATVDLAALENGARALACSNLFYSAADNMLAPGLSRNQAEGWETARRRDDGNDWAVIELAAQGIPELIELDTTNLLFNSPGEVRLLGIDHSGDEPLPAADSDAWFELLPRTAVQPDTPHRIRVGADAKRATTHVRLDIYPDGGVARLRVLGSLTHAGKSTLTSRWAGAVGAGAEVGK